MTFNDLQLKEPLLKSLREEGYTLPTPIQAQAIPHVLAGRDVLALAQTGTGKTAAFVLPILDRLTLPSPGGRRPIRVLVITPTRELASQVGESFSTYGRHMPFRNSVIFGGVGQRPQTDALSRGVDILVATPGRFLDLLHQRHVHLDRVEVLVLDEADRMLDMGFLPDVRRIIAACPKKRQTLFFSATMPSEAQNLADHILIEPVQVEVTPPATTVEEIDQAVFRVDKADKRRLLEHLLQDSTVTRALVFTRTKHGANRLAESLEHAGVGADAIHGNKSQGQRQRALGSFKAGGTRVLVATDIAARGIDVEGISHVINFELPNEPESYVHRIGRTGRAGAKGIAWSFCDGAEEGYLRDIERLIRLRIRVIEDHPFPRGRGPVSHTTASGMQVVRQGASSRPTGPGPAGAYRGGGGRQSGRGNRRGHGGSGHYGGSGGGASGGGGRGGGSRGGR